MNASGRMEIRGRIVTIQTRVLLRSTRRNHEGKDERDGRKIKERVSQANDKDFRNQTLLQEFYEKINPWGFSL